ncbi:hypothetical protein [Sphingobacterium thalpophilum]|uniref:hypothetical protein n=1 Tax=Sphingobacterium thalpophilum TaxID=259 RepID=UPI0031CDE8C5
MINLVNNRTNIVMKVFSFQSVSFGNLYVRWLTGIFIWLLVLGLFDLDVLSQHPVSIFFLYATPYLFYYTVCFLVFHNIWRHGYKKWLLLLPCALLLLGVYDIVKSYLYVLLPRYDVVFFFPWKEGDEVKLTRKIVCGLFMVTIYLSVDNLIWRIKREKAEIQRLHRRLDDVSNSQLLSGHFLRRLFDMATQGKIAVDLSVLDFFQYVINKMAQRNTMVSLEEEWRYLRQLVSMSVHRSFVIKGTEQVPDWLWNRSVPALTLMTWIENAAEYSPARQSEPILLEWCVCGDEVLLRIANRMESMGSSSGTGRGLELVNRLYEPLRQRHCSLHYRIVEGTYFVVELKFENSYAKV